VAYVLLVDDELVLLDGRCRPEVQKDVDAARSRLAMAARVSTLSPKEAGLVADVVTHAREHGRVTCVRVQIRSCPVCGRRGGYYRFKSGRRRGQEDIDRPLTITGVDLGRGFVVIQHQVKLGCCVDCWEHLKWAVATELADVHAEIPESVLGRPCAWRRFDVAESTSCSWRGHEGQMTHHRTLMNDGWYPAGCPRCGAENLAFGPTIVRRSSEAFVVAPLPLVTTETNNATPRRIEP
jgi:hypothetical protein